MGRHKGYVPAGVIPATLLAFNEDFSIDEAETRRHLTRVAGTAARRCRVLMRLGHVRPPFE